MKKKVGEGKSKRIHILLHQLFAPPLPQDDNMKTTSSVLI